MCLCAMKLTLYHFHVHKHSTFFNLRQLLFNKNQNLFDRVYWINFKYDLLFIIRCNVDLWLCAMIEMWWWNLKPGKYISIIFFQSLTYAAQKKQSAYTTKSSLVPGPSKRRSLGTESDKIERWRHIRNRQGRAGTRQIPTGVEECLNDKNQT